MRVNYGLALSGAAVLVLAASGCSRTEFQDSPPPAIYDAPQPTYQAPPPFDQSLPPPQPLPPPLPQPRADGRQTPLLGGQPSRAPEVVILMAPVPNPEDLSREEYERIYAPGEARQQQLAGQPQREYQRVTPQGQPPAPQDRAAQPGPATPREQAALSGGGQPREAAPQSARPSPRPAQPAPKARTEQPRPQTAQPARPTRQQPSALDRVGASISDQVAGEIVFEVPETLADGGEAVVLVTLPPNLAARIAEAAEEAGLSTRGGIDVQARLTGDGYAITPEGTQTQPLAAGQSAQFSWQVTPGEDAAETLGFEIDGAVGGETFEIARVERSVSGEPADGDRESGGLPERTAMYAILGVLALILIAVLVAASRNRRRTERRRRDEHRARELGEYSGQAEQPAAKTETRPKPAK